VSPVTHFLHGWAVAQFLAERRDRIIVTVAAVVPDIDALGIVAEILTRHSAHPLNWFSEYHHLLAHNLWAALLTTVAAAALARKKLVTALLACASFHLHLLGDLVGSRGPDGYQWPIEYLYPLSSKEWTWSGQWALASWQNVVVTVALLAFAFYIARLKRITPVEVFSTRADAAVVQAIAGKS
jgi:inner membrane protein